MTECQVCHLTIDEGRATIGYRYIIQDTYYLYIDRCSRRTFTHINRNPNVFQAWRLPDFNLYQL